MLWGVVLCFAAGLTLALTPLAGWLGRRWGLVDVPGGRRRHQGIVPRTGGLALFGGLFVTVLLLALLPAWEVTAPWFPARNDPHEERRLAALLVGSLYCVGFGLLDDRIGLKSGPQYLIQFGAALIACGGLIFVKHVNNPFGTGLLWGPDGFPGWLVFLLTTFWFMGMMNTINFLDGASGLVAGVTAVLAAVLALHMIFKAEPPQQSVA
ncbi:MAG: glycosyltransferase family 4 protein, partial [Caldilinea sp.]